MRHFRERVRPGVQKAGRGSVNRAFFYISLALLVASLGLYASSGYSFVVTALWLASIITLAYHFWLKRSRKKAREKFESLDLILLFALLLIFGLIYLYDSYTIPHQINSDEINIMNWERILTSQPKQDIFALSGYYDFPAFVFIVLGWAGKALGGISLLNMRIVNAVFGLGTILLAFLFFRAFARPLVSFGAAIVMGANHSLVALSRMAMRDNTPLFVELAAFAFLLRGFQKRCPFLTFVGGAFAGLGLYVYYPGRFAIVLWLAFLAIYMLIFRSNAKSVIKLGSVFLIGLLLVASPIILASVRHLASGEYRDGLKFQKEALLIFREGREVQQEWVFASSVAEGVKVNIWNGLTTFNKRVEDHSWSYPNPGHGFVDPLTGILLWVGFGALMLRILRKLQKAEDIFILAGFLLFWLLFAFVVNKSPNYTRLLITLPFVAYLAFEGIRVVVELASKLLTRTKFSGSAGHYASVILTIFIIALIFQDNMMIFGDFVAKGLKYGDTYGGTARYVEGRKAIDGYTFYLAASKEYPYYSWGQTYQWETWVGFFATKSQRVEVIRPEDMLEEVSKQPFTIFMNKRLYEKNKEAFSTKYSEVTVHNIKPDGSVVAVESGLPEK